ncbi:MAG: carbamoyltransferase HypF [Bacillota bacterium]
MQLAGESVKEKKEIVCLELKINGVVQGIGFRPHVFCLAREYGLKGWVRNESEGVTLEVEGEENKVHSFCRQLIEHPPHLAIIEDVRYQQLQPRHYTDFIIVKSRAQSKREALIPSDIAVCSDCLAEVMDPADRHFLYPFTNCTRCGPRFTIVEDIPYDRPSTSMRDFTPCTACAGEYNDPLDRRFHAQPVACPACGPRIEIRDGMGETVPGIDNWLHFFWEKMQQGHIFAVKGLGGFHLACLVQKDIIETLRKRKGRPFKPFAVMCRDLETVGKYCFYNQAEEEALLSPAAPIVLLRKKDEHGLPVNISPGMASLGVMLPYTPLHFLLMQGPFAIMVLTSANPTDLPILKDNNEALAQLSGIVDYYILHNRDIVQRSDDSVVRIVDKRIQYQRRSRGYVPGAVKLGFQAEAPALGAGSEMKNTFCLLKGKQAILSQHLGEMGTEESEAFYRESLEHFLRFFDLKPQLLGYDLHPRYRVSATARQMFIEHKYAVQHHHSHFASCLAENSYREKAIGAVLDGTGYGLDGAIWGLEIISGDFMHFKREYHQRYVPLPGGEAGVKWPWRMAMSYLYQALGNEGLSRAYSLFGRLFEQQYHMVEKIVKSGLYAIPTSSCGRLFDAVAALLGVCHENTYEGQAAIQLGELLREEDTLLPLEPYSCLVEENELDFSPMFPDIIKTICACGDVTYTARRFHDTVVHAVSTAVKEVSQRTGLKTVALSGGSWHNPYLLIRTRQILEEQGLQVLLHRMLPPGDGGLALGQAAVAYWRWKENVPGDTHEDSGDRQ